MSSNNNMKAFAAGFGIATAVFTAITAATHLGGCHGKKCSQGDTYKEFKTGSSVEELNNVFPSLLTSFIDHLRSEYSLDDKTLSRIERMCTYTCLGGKLNRGAMVLSTTKELCKVKNLSFQKRYQDALALGWCIEILQAHFLVADDIMDRSETRRGQPCWYKLPDVQYDAVNDAIILESFLYFLLNKHFVEDVSQHMKLIKLFHEVALCTQLGQLLDLTSQPQGREADLKTFTPTLYNQIVHYKTSIYSFYLSTACGMILCGYEDENTYNIARKISVAIGTKFQIEDDYLDAYGEPEKIGKIGTDIKDHKASWLCVQALLRMTAEQRAIFEEHYGKESKESEDVIKGIYHDLELEKIYNELEDSSYADISKMVDDAKDMFPPAIFMSILDKIHKREK